ncbi:MAG: hypothetical protein RLZZ127_142 [Planctomycetota bacterium]|jgi:hypothetical protein
MPIDPIPGLQEVAGIARRSLGPRGIRLECAAEHQAAEADPTVWRASPASLYAPAILLRMGGVSIPPGPQWSAMMATTLAWELPETPTSAWLLDAARPIPAAMLRALMAGSGRNLLVAPGWAHQKVPWMGAWRIHCPNRKGPIMPGAQRWRVTRQHYLAFLRHMDLVAAPPGPLLWDAMRLGIPVCDAEGHPHTEEALTPLAWGIPAGLAASGAWWVKMVGYPPSEWPHAFIRWRQEQAAPLVTPPGGKAGWVRKMRKLIRDPVLFCADSRTPWLRRLVARRIAT